MLNLGQVLLKLGKDREAEEQFMGALGRSKPLRTTCTRRA